jgi:hypothetical protein
MPVQDEDLARAEAKALERRYHPQNHHDFQ